MSEHVSRERAIAAAKHSAGVFCNDEDIETMRDYILQSPPTVEQAEAFVEKILLNSYYDRHNNRCYLSDGAAKDFTAELMTLVGGASDDGEPFASPRWREAMGLLTEVTLGVCDDKNGCGSCLVCRVEKFIAGCDAKASTEYDDLISSGGIGHEHDAVWPKQQTGE